MDAITPATTTASAVPNAPTEQADDPFVELAPFARTLGMALAIWEPGRSVVTYSPEASHLNTHGMAHGGAIMTLMDVGLARAARGPGMAEGIVTIELKTSFMRAASGPLRCEGRLIQRTATLAFVEGSVFDAQDRLCAHGTGTFKYVTRLPEQARAARRAASGG